MSIEREIKEHSNESGSTNWSKIENGECKEFFRFEIVGKPGYGAIEFQNGEWRLYATNGTNSNSRVISRDQAATIANNTKAKPGVKVVYDFSHNI